ncbi:MAG: carboxypeptidase-like regulatory domain-containing protein, partial [Candidatus Bathyarchaeia archaeon]
IYTVAGVFTGLVKPGDTRRSYTMGYLPTSIVAGDLDVGTPIGLFPATQTKYAPAGGYRFGDWIYNQAAGPVALGTVRASAVDWTDKGMALTGLLAGLLPAPWAADWANVVGYPASLIVPVAAGDSDVGRTLTAFRATDKHSVAGAYVSGDLIYRDNDGDNLISIGDTRQVIVATGLARIFAGPWPWLATAAPFYLPGTNVAAGDADIIATPLVSFAATEFYYDQFNDGAYLGSDLVAVGGVSTTGYAAPFPVANALPTAVPIPFTVPTNAPVGNHVVMITTDEPPFPIAIVMTAPFLNAGWKAFAFIAAGATQQFESLPWLIGPIGVGVQQDWDTSLFGMTAGPAFFAVIPKVCALQMSPGAYAHTLGTPAGIVELDYNKGSVVQNATGDISLNITLCSEASSISIYIPPEFTFLQPDTRSVWTSITNDYKRVSMAKRSSADPIGPMWWNLRIENSTIPIGGNVVRMFNVKAPDVCGRYFVKVFVDGESIGAENFPTIVVKGGLYPAYISGRVLNGDHGSYGVPVSVSGKVVAEGKTALGEVVQAQAYFKASANGAYILYGLAAGTYNVTASAAGFVPETLDRTVSVNAGQSLEGVDIYVYPSATISGTICSKCGVGAIPWGNATSRPISMEILDSNLQSKAWLATNTTTFDPYQAYYPFSFDGSIELDGHVPQDRADYVSGLAAGDYYLKAYVNGYLQRDVVAVHVYEYSRSVSVLFDLWRSSQFSVTVHFVDAGGSASPTPKDGTLTLEAYGLDGGIEGYNRTSVLKNSNSSTMMITGKNYGLPSGTYFIKASFPGYSQAFFPEATLGEGCSTTSLSFNMVRGGLLYITLRSINWQTPPQSVPWGYPDATIRIEAIGSEQVYSGTARQDITISEPPYVVSANITDLPPDTYLIRAYTVGYVQTRDYQVSMSFGGMSDIQIDLVKATKLRVTLTFRTEGLVATLDDTYRYNPAQVPARIEVYDSLGVLAGANATHIPADEANSTIEVVGFRSYAGNPCLRWVNYYDTTDGSEQNDYGLPPGTYQVLVWVPGYAQAQTMTFSTTLSITDVTLDLYFDRLAHVSGTVRGLDMYDNLIPLSWATVTAYGPTLVATSSLDGFYEMWIANGTYALGVSSPGYETQGVEIIVSMAWETPVDFDLTPAGSTTPELSATEWVSAALLV